MFQNILVLCLGNICRSPIAELLLRERTRQAGLNITIVSAGLTAMVGDSAHPFSQKVVDQNGLSLCDHVARQVTEAMIRNADLILVMDEEQRRILESQFKGAAGKTFRLGHFGHFDIPDPYGKDEHEFYKTYELIVKGIDAWINKLS